MELTDLLRRAERVVVCGIGNYTKEDDAFGVIGADKLKELISGLNVPAPNCNEVFESYIGKITKFEPDPVVFVDPVDFGGEHGELADLFTRILCGDGYD